MLKINNISFSYGNNKKILDDISLDVNQGDVLGILGINGAGKTTFIKCINNIFAPDSGTVMVNGKEIRSMTPKEIAQLIAYVPQYNGTFFNINVLDTVMMGRLPYAGRSYSEKDREIVYSILEKMNLEQFAFRSIREMSGGERQRVFIARALAQQPKIIILDEPTSSLDLHNQLFILKIIEDLAKKDNLTIIMIIHDLNLASMFCNKLVMLKEGKIYSQGNTADVLTEANIGEVYKVSSKITVEDGYKHMRLLKG